MEPKKVGEMPSSAHPEIKEITRDKIKKHLSKLSREGLKDEVDLSTEAKKISEYVEIIKRMPDIRKDKIREVEKKLASGEYDSKQVLEETLRKIIEEIL